MDRWANKVALVTGAGSGIGARMCFDLCVHNIVVVGLDLNQEGLSKTAAEIKSKHPSARFSSLCCDLTKEEEIKAAFASVTQEHGGVDILVNCAAIFCDASVLSDDEDEHERLIKTVQTNVLAVISCIRKAFNSMVERDAEGHIVNMCSVAGHCAVTTMGRLKPPTLYCATKASVRMLNQMIGHELVYFQKPKIRISNISPGGVDQTNIMVGTSFEAAARMNPHQLQPKDISDTLIFILATPSHV